MIEDFLPPPAACPDQWWPIEDDEYSDICPDQYWPDVPLWNLPWSKSAANPIQDIINVWRTFTSSGRSSDGAIGDKAHAAMESYHARPATVNYAGQTFEAQGFDIDIQYIDEMYSMDFTDPTVETAQTKADILAWKRSRNTGPPTEKWAKRGRKKK